MGFTLAWRGSLCLVGSFWKIDSQPRSRGFPAALLDRAFYARFRTAQNPKARFNGLMNGGFSRDAKAADLKHAGSALINSLRMRPSAKKRWSINPSGKQPEHGLRSFNSCRSANIGVEAGTSAPRGVLMQLAHLECDRWTERWSRGEAL